MRPDRGAGVHPATGVVGALPGRVPGGSHLVAQALQQPLAGNRLDGAGAGRLPGVFRLGRGAVRGHVRSTGSGRRGRAPGQRDRQTVDVEVPAPGRHPRDQRFASAGGPDGGTAAHLPGRDPQLFRARLPHQTGCAAAALHAAALYAGENRTLRPVLRGILRPVPFRHGRQGGGDGAGTVPGLAAASRPGRQPGPRRRTAVPAVRLQRLPWRRLPGARTGSGRPVRQTGAAGGRRHRHRRCPVSEGFGDVPSKQVAAGYPDIMPSFKGQISEEDLLKLLAYLQSLDESSRADAPRQQETDAP